MNRFEAQAGTTSFIVWDWTEAKIVAQGYDTKAGAIAAAERLNGVRLSVNPWIYGGYRTVAEYETAARRG